MVKIIKKDDKELYQCEQCGYEYEDKEWADLPAGRQGNVRSGAVSINLVIWI
ncbi:MAG: hypothetical protein NUV64_01450 [Parcubacteria group bacterium]|nr:hypothetical protein [Parcubacteria group bacterium]MCR4342710.1 hypothetical protein [Patescibacteria group bacterium]